MAIHKLSADIINKIAAGEVVERPASVIKELVENSLDAKASEIEIEIVNGGRDYIRVQDNGCGMNANDALMSIEQHATSKIVNVEDLFSLRSFGFRGEALASISSVSDFLLRTREHDSLEGSEVSFLGLSSKQSPVSCKKGTRIEVSALFKKIPARRQYLKSESTEYRHVLDTFIQFALSAPSVSFTLIHNQKTIYQLGATSDLRERISRVFKKDIADILLPVFFEQDYYRLEGFIGKPHAFSQSREYQYLFVNDRYVKSPVIHRAVLQAYGSLLPRGSQPVYLLKLSVQPGIVDVNVHPRKLEVRFADSDGVFRFVMHGLGQVLRSSDIVKNIDDSVDRMEKQAIQVGTDVSFGVSSQSVMPRFRVGSRSHNGNFSHQKNLIVSGAIGVASELSQSNGISENSYLRYDLGDWRLLGQVKNSYILVEVVEKGLLIIDQHGAAERVNYERLLEKYNSGESFKKQHLLLPARIEVSPSERLLLSEHLVDFDKVGFEFDLFEENLVAVKAVPTMIKVRDPQQIIKELLADLIEHGVMGNFTMDYMLKTVACKTAIKFGDALTIPEQCKLLHDIRNMVDNHLACAHGRPIILELGWDFLNSGFERR